jgi:hypothetical protein
MYVKYYKYNSRLTYLIVLLRNMCSIIFRNDIPACIETTFNL